VGGHVSFPKIYRPPQKRTSLYIFKLSQSNQCSTIAALSYFGKGQQQRKKDVQVHLHITFYIIPPPSGRISSIVSGDMIRHREKLSASSLNSFLYPTGAWNYEFLKKSQNIHNRMIADDKKIRIRASAAALPGEKTIGCIIQHRRHRKEIS
jgi:hypothetical protein